MWVIFDKYGKILKSIDYDCSPARMGSTDYRIFAIFLDRDISDCSATIAFRKPDYCKTIYPYEWVMSKVSRQFVLPALSEGMTDYAPLENNKTYEGFEFDFETDAQGAILLDTNGEWNYTINLYQGSLSDKRYVYIYMKNCTINSKETSYELVDVGTSVTYTIVPKTGYKLPSEIDINLDTGKYTYDKSTGILTINSVDTNIVASIVAKEKVVKKAYFHLTNCELVDATSPIEFDVDDQVVVNLKSTDSLSFHLPQNITITGESDYTWSTDGVTGTLTFTANAQIASVDITIIAIPINYHKLTIIGENGVVFFEGSTLIGASKVYSLNMGTVQTIGVEADTSVILPDIDTANFIIDPSTQRAQVTKYEFASTAKKSATLEFTMGNEDTIITIKGVN